MTINTVVIDIEDLDLSPTAVILSIGAIAFDVNDISDLRQVIKNEVPVHSHVRPKSLYLLVDTFDQLMSGRTVSKSTQHWWKQQGEEAKKALTGPTARDSIESALVMLAGWFYKFPSIPVYFRGPDHDGAILENAFKMYGIQCPWKYNQKRDVRTFIDVKTGGSKGYLEHTPSFEFVKHNALHDAMNDAEQMCLAHNQSYELIKGNKQ